MTYKINKTDGSLLAEIVDSSIDQTATDITLIGKNVSGYGEFINENLIKLLENFANTSAPNNPITGQIWFDTAENRLKVYDGNGFKIGSGPIVSGTAPTNLVQGDFWIDSAENQLHFSDGTDTNVLVGPIYTATQGISGFEVRSIYDTSGALRVIVLLWVSEILLGIFSKQPIPFTPSSTIPGFTGTIKPGFNAGTLSGMKFNVRTSEADAIVDSYGNLKTPNDFLSTSESVISAAGTLALTGVSSTTTGKVLLLGQNGNFEISATSAALKIDSNISGQDYNIRIKNSTYPSGYDAITIKSVTQHVGIFNPTPEYTLDVGGSMRVSSSFLLPRYTTIERDARTMTSANNGELIYNTTNDKIQAFAAGSWIDLN